MSSYSSPGKGVGQSGAYNVDSGFPASECLWYADQSSHDKVIGTSSAIRFKNDVIIWSSLKQAELINLDNGDVSVVAEFDPIVDEFGMDSQVSASCDFLQAGPLLLDAKDFSLKADFEKALGEDTLVGQELINAPVRGGFLYLAGNYTRLPRKLYFVDTASASTNLLGEGFSRVVAIPGAEVFFAIRECQLMCGNARTGEVIWQRTVPLQWSEHSSEKGRVESRVEKASIKCSETEVMLFLSGAGFYRFNAQSGELIYHLDTYYDSVGFGGARHFRESDGVFFGPDLYYVIHCNEKRTNAIRAFAFDDNRLVFEQSAEGGYEKLLFIAGDLIFSREAVLKSYIARDRYNGEVVWQSKDYLPRIHFGLPVGNKIFLYGGAGHMICYEWSEPYVSPHRLLA